jgi:hypothetical protein
MREIAAPTAEHVQVLSIEVEMWINARFPVVSVLSDNHIGACIARELHSFDNGGGVSGCLNDHVGSARMGDGLYYIAAASLWSDFDIKRLISAHGQCQETSILGGTDGYNLTCSPDSCERNRAESYRAGTLDNDSVVHADSSTFYSMEGRWGSASPADKCFRVEARRQTDCLYARFEVNILSPAAKGAVVLTIGYAVNFSARTAGAVFTDKAVPATAAGFVNVKKGDQFAFLEWDAVNVRDGTINFRNGSYANVTGNKRIRYSGKSTMVQMDIGAADLGKVNLKEHPAGFKFRKRSGGHFESFSRRRHNDCLETVHENILLIRGADIPDAANLRSRLEHFAKSYSSQMSAMLLETQPFAVPMVIPAIKCFCINM